MFTYPVTFLPLVEFSIIIGFSSNTDTHWRCQGFASFNWRLVFKLTTDCYTEMNSYNMEVRLWDKDICTPNDYLCSYSFTASEIYSLITNCIRNERSAKYKLANDSRKDGKFEVETTKNKNKKDAAKCRILMSIECLTEAEYDFSYP